MEIACFHGWNVLTYRDKCAKDWLIKFNACEPLPPCKLNTFSNLYEKIKSDQLLLHSNIEKFIPTVSQERSIKNLDTFRNDLVHYKYGGLIVVLGKSPLRIICDCLDFIDFLAFKSNNIYWGVERPKKTTRLLLEKCKKKTFYPPER